MDILELCKGKYAGEVDSIVTDVEGNTKEVNSFADSIEKHDGVKYTTPESRKKIVEFIGKNPFFSLYILMDILIRTPLLADLCYRGRESKYYTALINKPPTEDTYDANITAFLLLFIRFKPSAEVQLSILKLWLVDGDPGDNDNSLAFTVRELISLYLDRAIYRQ